MTKRNRGRWCTVLSAFGLSVGIGACGVSSEEVSTGGDVESEHQENLTAAACTPYLGQQCYWMENTSGSYCWVPATWVSSFYDCYAQDSCDGGLSRSGGGCYKWADCSGCTRYPWQ